MKFHPLNVRLFSILLFLLAVGLSACKTGEAGQGSKQSLRSKIIGNGKQRWFLVERSKNGTQDTLNSCEKKESTLFKPNGELELLAYNRVEDHNVENCISSTITGKWSVAEDDKMLNVTFQIDGGILELAYSILEVDAKTITVSYTIEGTTIVSKFRRK